jgi:hypothetical protein
MNTKRKFKLNALVKLNQTFDYRKTGGPFISKGTAAKVIRRCNDGSIWVDLGRDFGRRKFDASCFTFIGECK